MKSDPVGFTVPDKMVVVCVEVFCNGHHARWKQGSIKKNEVIGNSIVLLLVVPWTTF